MEQKELYVTIEVRSGRETLQAKISPGDYSAITAISKIWRLSSSGYPIHVKRVNGKLKTEYMHKIVAGGQARHINGDRLDNRRSNLLKMKQDSSVDIEIDEETLPFPMFIGTVKDGKPEGYGTLVTELETHLTHETGLFENGELVEGMITKYGRRCNCDQNKNSPVCINRDIVDIMIITS